MGIRVMKTLAALVAFAAVCYAVSDQHEVTTLDASEVQETSCYPGSNNCRFEDKGAKQCPTSATGMSNSDKSESECASECLGNSACGGFVYKSNDSNGSKCRPKASSCTESSA